MITQLNFVNNFSEVNKELLAELNEEIDKGNFEEVIDSTEIPNFLLLVADPVPVTTTSLND